MNGTRITYSPLLKLECKKIIISSIQKIIKSILLSIIFNGVKYTDEMIEPFAIVSYIPLILQNRMVYFYFLMINQLFYAVNNFKLMFMVLQATATINPIQVEV